MTNRDQRLKPCADGCGKTTRGTRCKDCFAKIPARERSGRFGQFQLRPSHLKTGTTRTVNAPPPKDMDDIDPRPTSAIEADIASKAAAARNQVEARFTGEGGKAETATGKAIERQLGIERKR